MSSQDRLNWSTDLLRISSWLQNGNVDLANKFIERGRTLYPTGQKVAGKDWDWWFSQLKTLDSQKAAERALTWSVLIK